MLAAALMILTAAAAPEPDRRPINVVAHAWAPFISPMGEPFRARNATDDTLGRWFNQADRNHDGQITPEEMEADADRFFTLLDGDGDGQIQPDELIHYEWELAPDIQLSSRLKRQPGEVAKATPADSGDERTSRGRPGRRDPDWLSGGLQGAARYGLLNMPEPVAAADADFNRAISRAEFRQAALTRFALLDPGHRKAITLPALEARWTAVLAGNHQRKRGRDEVDTRVGMPLPPGP